MGHLLAHVQKLRKAMKHLIRIAALLGAISYANAQGTFEAVHSASGGSITGTGTGGTIGWSFEPLTEIRVTDLGCFQFYVQDQGAVQVGIWTDTGALLASNNVSATDLQVNSSVYQAVPPIVLLSNTVYVIGLHALSGNTPYPVASPPDGAISMSSDIQLHSAVNADSGFAFPVNNLGDGAMLVGPNFLFNSNIPEPATVALLGLGLAALVVRRLRVRH
jgi:hypothetical protein